MEAFNKENLIIIKSQEDKRSYRALELENQLRILLISDPDTDKSAASLRVNIGSMSDPDDLPGLAHFCEHMLFMGTEKYPCENEFSKYISEHGGYSNAYTALDHTNYYFDIIPEYFEGILDRFAQFFLKPLFAPNAVDREVKAVNSECEKDLPLDNWRLAQLLRSTSKNGHPFQKFNIGNNQTLAIKPKEKGIDVREELLKFHEINYSANLMTVALLGKENLDDLEKMAKPLFLNVVNKNVERPVWNDHPLGPEQLQEKFFVVPVKDIRKLEMCFPMPDLDEYYKSGPARYIWHLVGHEGPGSILSTLKAKGWCDSISTGNYTAAKGFGFFYIVADLTEEGIEKVDKIITLVFQYLNMLREVGPQKWIFEEIQQMASINFRFKDKEDPKGYVRYLVNNMQKYPLDEVLNGSYNLEEWRPELIEMVLGYLKPFNMRVLVTGKKFEPIADLQEFWYGTKYKLEKIPEPVLKKWETCGQNNELSLPTANEFITSNFEILKSQNAKTDPPHPLIIQESAISRIWFKQDDKFLLPKADLFFEFFSPISCLDPLNSAMTNLYTDLLKDSLNEYAYSADLAGLYYKINPSNYGFVLKIKGFNDKQNILLDKISDKIADLKINPQRFDILKEEYIRNLKNFKAEQPYNIAYHYLQKLVTEQFWSKEELLEASEKITLKQLEEFIPQLLSKLHIEFLAHGNVNKEKALERMKIVEEKLKSRYTLTPLLPEQLQRNREIRLKKGSHFIFETTTNYHKSSCSTAYYQCFTRSTKNNILIKLLRQILEEPCFDILRTKEQLGYIVASFVRPSNNVQGLVIAVQSDKHPDYVDKRIEAFLIKFREMVIDMRVEEFEKYKEALAAILSEKPKKLSELTNRFWDEIWDQEYHFIRVEDEVAYLNTITKEEILSFFDDYIKVDGLHRKKLSVNVISKVEGGAGTLPEVGDESLSKSVDGFAKPLQDISPKRIKDVTMFKTSHGLFNLAKPYANLATYIETPNGLRIN